MTRRTAVGALLIALSTTTLGVAGCVGGGAGGSEVRSLRIFPTSTVVEAARPLPVTSTTVPATVPTSTVTGAVAAPTTTTTTTKASTPVVTKPTVTSTTTQRPSTVSQPRSVPAPTTTTTARPTGLVDEQSGNGYVFVYNDDPSSNASGSATTLERGATPRRLDFVVSGGIDHAPVAKFQVDITNVSGRELSFPGGLDVRWVVQRNGAPWKTVHLTRPEITGLTPGGKLSGSQQVILDQFGEYTFSGNVTVQYR